MVKDKKRLKSSICLSKVFELRELCPDELKEVRPDITGKICDDNKK
jgi:hypothetical protein